MTITREIFGAALGSTVVFETSDLDICRGVAVEIHPSAWEAIALTVSTVVVKNDDSASRGGVDYYFSPGPELAYILIISRWRGRRSLAALSHPG